MIDDPDDPMPAMSPGKSVLLQALEHIEEIEGDHDGSIQYLAVVYAVQHTDEDGDTVTTRGWDATPHPHFVITGLLNEVAGRINQDALDPGTDVGGDDD